jgi:hypothetical protein
MGSTAGGGAPPQPASGSIKSNKAAVIRARYNELLSRLGESIGVEGVIAQIPAR